MKAMGLTAMVAVVLFGCGAEQSTNTSPVNRADRQQESERRLEEAPFLTLNVGPKSIESQDATPEAFKDREGMYFVLSGDADGFHRFISLSPWDPGFSEPQPTDEKLSNWKTEHGFGIGSWYSDVWDKIGHPTTSAMVAQYQADVYLWEYDTDFLFGATPATHQLTIIYEEGRIVGLIIDIDEMP